MGNLIVGAILAACIFFAVRYLYRQAKKGQCAAAPAAKADMTVTAAGRLLQIRGAEKGCSHKIVCNF